jgi:hypothetical protein
MSKKGFQSLALAAAAAATLACTAQLARATEFDWSYSGDNGGAVSASGVLFATPDGGGEYTVTSISGTRNGVSISGLATYAGDDNLVYTTTPHVDYPGLAYSVTGGAVFNVYYDTSTADDYACGAVGYCEIGPGVAGTTGLGPPVDSIGAMSSFTLTAVPELSTWAMMGVGFGGLAFAGYQRTKRHAAAAVVV